MNPPSPEYLAWQEKMRNAIAAQRVLKNAERAGIAVNGITLAASERDRSMFAQMLVMLREAENLQPDESAREAFRASPQAIADSSGTIHTMSVTDLRTLLVAYGAAYQALWTVAAQPAD